MHDQLPFYVAGTLPPDERATFERHLAACPECRAALREWQVIAEAVRQDAAARPESGDLPPLRVLHTSPSRSLQSDEHLPISGNGWSHYSTEDTRMITYPQQGLMPRRYRTPALTLIAALLALVLFGGALLFISTRGGSQPGNPAGNSSGSDGQLPGAFQNTETATPVPSQTDVLNPAQITGTALIDEATRRAVVTATPVLPTVFPPTVVAPDSTPVPHNMEATTEIEIVPDDIPPIPANDISPPTPVGLPPVAGVVPSSVFLEGVRYEAQGWNNQSPATLAMALSYWGWAGDQDQAARWLKPNPEDKSVTAGQMVTYVHRQTNYRALVRMGGTLNLLKGLLAAGFPVIIETGINPAGEGWMGHNQLLVGYDDSLRAFRVFDSYLGNNNGEGRPVPYEVLDEGWREFNRTFIVVYDPARVGDLWLALGDYADAGYADQTALNAARSDAANDSTDLWAWFNLGTSYTALGDYENAALAYDYALQLNMPFRLLWYQFGPYEAYYEVGRYDDVEKWAESALATTEYVEQSYYWLGMANAARGFPDMAGEQFAKVIDLNPTFFAAEREHNQGVLPSVMVLEPTVAPPVPATPTLIPSATHTVTPTASASPTFMPTP
jgi:tetratricopeptide (TPR) repeat protein